LRLPRVANAAAQLADGKTVRMDVYAGMIRWGGLDIPVRINAADTDPLIGMGLLGGYELRIAVRRGGAVTIRRLKMPAKRRRKKALTRQHGEKE
jgi:predicted aspartyl protease